MTDLRDRYNKKAVELNRIETETPHKLRRAIIETLSDEKRAGAPSKFVSTGEIAAPLIQPTRTEEDFVKHIENVISLYPNDKQYFIN